MRIFETFVVALLVVLMFTFVLNKKLDAGDKETAKLEEKLETAFKAMEWLRTDLAAARKQLKQHTAQLEQLKERDKKLVAGLKEGNKTLLATLKERDKELVADLDDLHKYDKELAAWLKKRDKELLADLKDWDKRTLENVAALHDFVQRLQNDVRKEDERLSRKLTIETNMAFNTGTKLATELCANMIVHYARITHTQDKLYPLKVIHKQNIAPHDLKKRLLALVR